MTTKTPFSIEVLAFEEIHSLPGAWKPDRLRALLERFDYASREEIDAIPDPDLPEMAAMAAQDKGLREAADHVLSLVFGESMSAGVRQNLTDDLTGERPWELIADLHRQAGVFESVEFLQRAFPTEFGVPDAARVRVRLTASGKHATQWLREGPKSSLLVRLLAEAMDPAATLRRLYAEKLEGAPFPEADSIPWTVTRTEDDSQGDPASCVLEVQSSLQWIEPLRDSEGVHPSDAEPDDEPDD